MRTPTRYQPSNGQPRLLLGMELLNICIKRATEEGISVSQYVRNLIMMDVGLKIKTRRNERR